MNVEYTARQYEITPLIRKQVEHGLGKLTKILGDGFESKVILVCEKHRFKADITVTVRKRPLVGAAEAADMVAAVGEALDRIERQAIKHRTRSRAIKRSSHKKWVAAEAPREELRMAVGASATTAVPVVVHNYPLVARTTEAHVSRSSDAVALRPMTLEEAVKEAEFRDREVFVFRDAEGKVKVLHRKKDGKMELIEAP
jgi:putative sigma-54 modulation protein